MCTPQNNTMGNMGREWRIDYIVQCVPSFPPSQIMPIKSRSNQGDNDSALSVVDPVKPKTNYLRCMVGFGLASALLIITSILLIINVGVFAYLHAHYANIPRFFDILMISSFVCRGLAFINAGVWCYNRVFLFGPNE